MNDQIFNGLMAGGLGMVAAVLLLLPVAAVQYRRDGRLGAGDLIVLLAAAVYALALWTYTLLPLPAGDFTCAGKQLTPFGTIGEIGWSGRGVASLIRDAAFLQVALNVVLFAPLGWFVRLILRRGFVVATLLGAAISLLIETTQATGVWHLYDCAFRVFDVDDLILNTTGALLGSLVAAIFVRRKRPEVVWPTTLSAGRRLMGMLCDVLFVALLGATLVVAWRSVNLYGYGTPVADLSLAWQRFFQFGVPGIIEVLMVLGAGRTVGEWVVAVRAVPERRSPLLVARVIKLLAGIGPFLVLGWSDAPWSAFALLVFGVVSVIAVWATPDRRGLSHKLSGQRLELVVPVSSLRTR